MEKPVSIEFNELFLWYGSSTSRLISSRDNCQGSSQSRISDTPRTGSEFAQNLSLGLAESKYAVVIMSTPWRYKKCYFE